jgi:site-specific recombinase XerD
MKPYKSFMYPKLEEFLAYHESLGYTTKSYRSHLHVFDRYLKEQKAHWHSLQPAFFLDMRANLNMEASSVNRILSTVRSFFQFLVRRGYYGENPLRDIPHLKENTVVPFIFSPEQIDQILQAICKDLPKTKRRFLRDLAISLALLLLARCGLRISEPLRLKLHHYRPDDATIYIEKTKFSKDRLIPIPKSVITQIENYLSVRKSLLPHAQSPYLLIRANQRPLTDQQLRFLFHKTLKHIGLDQPRKLISNMNFSQPTPHSLRHSFAVNTLVKIKQRGQSPQNALPMLAAYMGHSEYKHTSLYLRAVDAISRKNLYDFALRKKRKQ